METGHTNKDILFKGMKRLGISLVCMFTGPTLFYIAFTNEEKPLFIPLLILSGIICTLAIYFAFKGLKTIMDSLFNS